MEKPQTTIEWIVELTHRHNREVRGDIRQYATQATIRELVSYYRQMEEKGRTLLTNAGLRDENEIRESATVYAKEHTSTYLRRLSLAQMGQVK